MDYLMYHGIPSTTIIGTSVLWNGHDIVEVVVYSGRALVEHFVYCGMTEDEAHEHIHFNMIGACVDRAQPIIVWETDVEDIGL